VKALLSRLLLLPVLASAQTLDFEVYRTQVEPIFLKKRPTHARCVSCHVAALSRFQLQMLPDGQTAWTPEQTRLNFQAVSQLVNFKDVLASPILKHPLAEDAGGDKAHSGGEQFKTRDDPDWKIIEAWIRAAK
jgi:hypothetical protein